MGLVFVAFFWLIIIIIGSIILSPLSIIGYRKFKRKKSKAWLILCAPGILLIILPIVFISFSIFTFIFFGPHGPTNMPKEVDVIGTYNLSQESKIFLSERKNYQVYPDTISVIFEANGKMYFKNLPDCLFNGFGESNGKFINKTENWNIGSSSMIWSWIEGWPISHDEGFQLYGEPPNYKLHASVGDPDSGETLIFNRE